MALKSFHSGGAGAFQSRDMFIPSARVLLPFAHVLKSVRPGGAVTEVEFVEALTSNSGLPFI